MLADKKILTYKELVPRVKRWKSTEKIVVLTTGCYDVLHVGHIAHFEYCKSKGDILVVSIGNDETVRLLKGAPRPINPERFRAQILAALRSIDIVVISEEIGKMDHDRLVLLIKPDVYVVPETDSMLTQKRYLIENVGGRMITCRHLPPNHYKGGISTTNIEKKLRLD